MKTSHKKDLYPYCLKGITSDFFPSEVVEIKRSSVQTNSGETAVFGMGSLTRTRELALSIKQGLVTAKYTRRVGKELFIREFNVTGYTKYHTFQSLIDNQLDKFQGLKL